MTIIVIMTMIIIIVINFKNLLKMQEIKLKVIQINQSFKILLKTI